MLIQRMQWTSGCKLFSRRLVKCSTPHVTRSPRPFLLHICMLQVIKEWRWEQHGSKAVWACAQAKLTLWLHSLLFDLSDVVASVSTFSSGRPDQRRVYPSASDLLIAK